VLAGPGCKNDNAICHILNDKRQRCFSMKPSSSRKPPRGICHLIDDKHPGSTSHRALFQCP
jgi:hypothetical protein